MINLQVFLSWVKKLADFMIKNTNNNSLFSSLSGYAEPITPGLYQLADKIDWGKFETAFQPLYCQSNEGPGKPICLMGGYAHPEAPS